MRDDAPELGAVAFHFDEGAAKLGLFGALGECFLEQTAEPILLPLHPKDVLNFLQSTRARDVSSQNQTTQDLSTGEPGRVLEGFEAGALLIGVAIYARYARSARAIWIFGLILLAIQYGNLLVPLPESPLQLGAMALASYLAFAAAAWFVEDKWGKPART